MTETSSPSPFARFATRTVGFVETLLFCSFIGGISASVTALLFGYAYPYLLLTMSLLLGTTAAVGLRATATGRLTVRFRRVPIFELRGIAAILPGLALLAGFGLASLVVGVFAIADGVQALAGISYELADGPLDDQGRFIGMGRGFWFAVSLPVCALVGALAAAITGLVRWAIRR